MNKIADKRKANIQFQKSGTGSQNTRINLPITWIRDILNITEDDREVDVILTDDNQIIIRKSEKEL